MESWFADNWYVVWGLVGTAAILAYQLYRRGGEESLPRRVWYVFFPIVDPKNKNRWSPQALFWWCIGTFVFIVVFLMVDSQ